MARQKQPQALAADAVTLRHVLGEGFISNGPLASATVAVVAAAAFGAGALPLTVILGSIIILTWINTPYQFSAQISSAGGIFSFIRASLGNRWGFAGSIGYFLYYVLLVPGNALVLAGLFSYVAAGFGISLPAATWIAMLAVVTVVPFFLSYFKITPTLTYGVVTAVIEAIVLIAVSIALIVHAGAANTASVFTSPHLAVGGWKGVIIGMAIASTALGGPDAVVFLGEEARGARHTIRKALLITQFSVIGLYLLYSYAVTVSWGPAKMGTFALAPAPGLALVGTIAGRIVVLILALLILNSSIGVNLAINITASRMLFDQARAGLLPRYFARVHPRFRTPTVALAVTFVIEVVVAVIARLAWGATNGFIVCLVGATAGGIFSFIITDAALIVFGWRRQPIRVLWTIVVPAVSIGLLVLSCYGNFFPITFPASIGAIFALACMILCGGYAVTRRSRSAATLAAEPEVLPSPSAGQNTGYSA